MSFEYRYLLIQKGETFYRLMIYKTIMWIAVLKLGYPCNRIVRKNTPIMKIVLTPQSARKKD